MPLIDLKYTAEEILEERAEASVIGGTDPYPWGLNISMDSDVLEKLGLSEDALQPGGEVHMTVVARVTSVNKSASMQEDDCRVGMTIVMAQVDAVHSAEEEKGEPQTAEYEQAEMAAKRAPKTGLLGRY
jgi:hypothetical protein